MSSAKFAGAVKHPVWVSLAAVVGVLALVVAAFSYFQSSDSPGDGLSIAAVGFGEPVDLSATELPATLYEEDRYTIEDLAVEPIDVTFKNAGGAVASISTVTAIVLRSEYIVSCLRYGAGATQVSAEYALRVPSRQLLSDNQVVAPVSSGIDFQVGPGETSRVKVTVGPNDQETNVLVVMAVRLVFGLNDGTAVETEPIVVGTTQELINQFIADTDDPARPVTTEVAARCAGQLAQLDGVISVGKLVSEPVQRLREAYQQVS